MVRAADIDRVHQMIENVLAHRHCRRSNQIWHEIHTKVAAAIEEHFQNLVRLTAWMRINRGTSRMRNQHRLRGGGNPLGSRAIAAMTEIDGYSDFVHFLDRRKSGLA